MPTRHPTSRTPATRGRWTRTSGNILANDPDGWVSDGTHGPVWWIGTDTGGGARPIGPNGPYAGGVQGIPAIIRATALITGPLTAAPFRVLEGGFGGKPLGKPRWITDPQLLRPDDRYPGVTGIGSVIAATNQLARGEFWTTWLRAAIWWGMGALMFVPDATGQPTAGTLVIINPTALTTRVVDGSRRWVLMPDDYAPEAEVVFDRDGQVTIGGTTWRLIVLRNPHSPVADDGTTQGVFEMSPAAFGLAAQIDGYASTTFRSGVPAGYLKVETPGLQQAAADELKAKWMAAHGGDRRSIAILNSTTTFTPISLSPVDAALGEAKRLNLADVAFAFGLDPITLGVSLANSATYNNVQEAWRNHRDFGLTLWISAVQDTLSALLPGTQGIVVNTDAFAAPPPGERYAAYADAIAAGILTVDEVRDLEGLPPLPPAPPPPPQLQQAPPEPDTDGEPEQAPTGSTPAGRGLPDPPWKVIAR